MLEAGGEKSSKHGIWVQVPEFPKITTIGAWEASMCLNLKGVLGYTDGYEGLWFMQTQSSAFESLEDSGNADLH